MLVSSACRSLRPGSHRTRAGADRPPGLRLRRGADLGPRGCVLAAEPKPTPLLFALQVSAS